MCTWPYTLKTSQETQDQTALALPRAPCGTARGIFRNHEKPVCSSHVAQQQAPPNARPAAQPLASPKPSKASRGSQVSKDIRGHVLNTLNWGLSEGNSNHTTWSTYPQRPPTSPVSSGSSRWENHTIHTASLCTIPHTHAMLTHTRAQSHTRAHTLTAQLNPAGLGRKT